MVAIPTDLFILSSPFSFMISVVKLDGYVAAMSMSPPDGGLLDLLCKSSIQYVWLSYSYLAMVVFGHVYRVYSAN
jgi:hypothetical protein